MIKQLATRRKLNSFWHKPKRRKGLRYCKTVYDKDGRAVKSEQLLGLVIELNANGNSYLKSEGTIIASSSTVYNNAGWVLLSIDSYGLRTSEWLQAIMPKIL